MNSTLTHKYDNNTMFSVIVPVYKTEKYLNQCIDSVLAQAFTSYEIILVDDGSPDKSGDICDVYAKEHAHVRVIHQENRGLSGARNAGMEIATGQYIIFLDSDDFWCNEDIFNRLFGFIQGHGEPDIIINGFTWYFDDLEKQMPQSFKCDVIRGFFDEHAVEMIETNKYPDAAWCKVVKNKLIIENSLKFPEGKLHEDCAWSFDIAKYADTFAIIDFPFYMYRFERVDSITNNINAQNVSDLIDIVMIKQQQLSENRKVILKKYLTRLSIGIKDYYYKDLSYSDQIALKDKFITFNGMVNKEFCPFLSFNQMLIVKFSSILPLIVMRSVIKLIDDLRSKKIMGSC